MGKMRETMPPEYARPEPDTPEPRPLSAWDRLRKWLPVWVEDWWVRPAVAVMLGYVVYLFWQRAG